MPEPVTATVEPITPATQEPKQQGDPAGDGLGEGGKKALDAERTARKAAEKATSDLQAQLDQINRANESALETAQREAKDAQEAAAKAVTESLRYRIAAEHGITADTELILTASDEATMRKQAALWSDRTSTSPRPDLSQGGNTTSLAGDPATAFANFIKQQTG